MVSTSVHGMFTQKWPHKLLNENMLPDISYLLGCLERAFEKH